MTLSAPSPVVSVVICTVNRAPVLAEAIASLQSAATATPHEVIVVDNGSTDNTASVVRSLARPDLHYVFDSTPGLSQARNTGWQTARGQIVAYLDDDATAWPGWVDAIERGFRQDPDAGAIGGPVHPVWHAPRPPWLQDEIAHCLTILDWGDTPRRLDVEREWLVGANIAFRRTAIEAVGGFEDRLGRQIDNLISNEETFLLRQIARMGHGVLYWPEMAVNHPVPSSRLDPRWLVQRHFWQGISDAVVWQIESGADPAMRREKAIEDAKALPSPSTLSAPDAGIRFTLTCRAARLAGFVTGLLRDMGA